MAEEFDKERQELLDRFKESLRGNATDYFFDEDDLVEIFDYAGDMNNDYLRAEVLMRAARFYPDSEVLKQRRILFYSDVFDPAMMEGFTDDYADNHSLLAEISFLRSSGKSNEYVLERMKYFLENYPPFDDEETIRFVSLAESSHLLDWVYRNFSLVSAHVMNEDVLLYELGFDFCDTTSHERDYDRASELLGKLVEKLPFVADYWQMLALAQYYSKEHRAKYQDSLELALALDPTHREALSLKATIIGDQNSPQEFKAELREICDICYDQVLPVKLLLSTMNDEELKSEGVERLVKLLESNPDSFFAMSKLLAIDPEEALRHIDSFDDAARTSSTGYNTWAFVLYHLVFLNPSAIRPIVDHIIFAPGKNIQAVESELYNAAIEAAFFIRDFDLMIQIIEKISEYQETRPTTIVFLAMANAKSGNIEYARTYAEMFMKMDLSIIEEGNGWHTLTRFVNIGARNLMEDLLKRTAPDATEPFDPESYNPYDIWDISGYKDQVEPF